MPSSFPLYLAEVSFCVAVFGLAHRWWLAGLRHFAWDRAYLLGALVASLVLPLLLWPGPQEWLAPAPAAPAGGGLLWQWQWRGAVAAAGPEAANPEGNGPAQWLPVLVLAGYLGGAGYRLWGLLRDLRWVCRLVRHNPRIRQQGYWLVRVQAAPLPAFSFAGFVFLSAAHDALSARDRQLVLLHEAVHVRQRHTYDLLLAEAVGVLLWFHPLLKYLKTQLKDVHEHLADSAVARVAGAQQYGRLLVHLAAQQPPVALVHALSSKQIFARIHLLTQPPSSPMKKIRFLLVVPVVATAWLATSACNLPSHGPATSVAPFSVAAPAAGGVPIGHITWQGNTVVSTERLNQALGLKPGDAYDSATVARRLSLDPAGRDVASLYLDEGYLFFSVVPRAKRQPNGTVDVVFTLSEGPQVRVRKLVFVGNKKVAAAELARLVPLRAGDLFSRRKVMQAQKNLAGSGYFDPAKVGVNPQPVLENGALTGLLDVEFVVVEKK